MIQSPYAFMNSDGNQYVMVFYCGTRIGNIEVDPVEGLCFLPEMNRHGNPVQRIDEDMWDEFRAWFDKMAFGQ